NATLMLAVRPIQVNPGWQFLARPGGAADITSIRRDVEGITINDTTTIIPITKFDSFSAKRFDEGQIFGARVSSPAQRVDDPFASASAAMHYNLDLRANEPTDVIIAIPFHETPALLGDDFEAELNANRTLWRSRLGRVAIHLPDEAAHIARAIRSNLAYILINADGPSIQPGSRSYDRSWIRDGSLTSSALLRLGHPEEVRRFIEWYARFQRADGYVPCCVSLRGGDPVPEHDSHGQFIYLIKEYYDFTGDRAFLQRLWPNVAKAVEFIDTLRRQRMTPEYESPEKRAFYGLVPESISHEGYSAKPMHSYWDDFFILTGVKDATEIAQILGEDEATKFAAIRDEFRANLYASIDRAMATQKIDFIPGSVELGDFDATSTTTAINPGGELRFMPQPATQRTFDRYWEEFVARRDGGKPWENYTPYEWRTVGTFIRLGQPERAHEITRWFFTHVRPPAWNHWAEVVWNDAKTPKFIGDMPHTWVGSDFIRSVIDMFAFESDDGALVIGAGIPEQWVSGDPIGVEKLRTPYGALTWTMTRDGSDVLVRIEEGIEVPSAGIVVGDQVIRQLPAEVRLKPKFRHAFGARVSSPAPQGRNLIR
ncbi:MAG TPA: coagulation factor 5/8 type domain-containing protein, partial [Thermoanaerobaculia bacterium]